MSMHFIISYHPCHYLCIHDILFHAHTYRIAQRSILLEFEEEAEDNQGTPQTTTPEGEELATDKLLECPDHQPTSFLKGKPRSILSLLCFTKYHLSPLCLMH